MIADILKDIDRCNELIKNDIGIYADFSRNHFNIDELLEFISFNLKDKIEDMFEGKHVNVSEDRAALHTALRIPRELNKYPEVWQVLDKINFFTKNNKFKTFIVIGIGGSYLGTKYIHDALKHVISTDKKLYFVSNVDPISYIKFY